MSEAFIRMTAVRCASCKKVYVLRADSVADTGFICCNICNRHDQQDQPKQHERKLASDFMPPTTTYGKYLLSVEISTNRDTLNKPVGLFDHPREVASIILSQKKKHNLELRTGNSLSEEDLRNWVEMPESALIPNRNQWEVGLFKRTNLSANLAWITYHIKYI